MEPAPLRSLALAGGVLTTSSTWESSKYFPVAAGGVGRVEGGKTKVNMGI